jgi:ribosomal protein S12 methylthiotransferase accessory factor YcaO
MDIEAISKAVLELLASRDDARSGFEPGATMRRSTRFFSEDELQEAAENLRRLLRK